MEEVLQTSQGDIPSFNAVDKVQEKSLAGRAESGSSLRTKNPPPRSPSSSCTAPGLLTPDQKHLLINLFANMNDCPPAIAEKYLTVNGWNLEVKAVDY
jgi:hypothetical protein